jgi:hypothetical protein
MLFGILEGNRTLETILRSEDFIKMVLEEIRGEYVD